MEKGNKCVLVIYIRSYIIFFWYCICNLLMLKYHFSHHHIPSLMKPTNKQDHWVKVVRGSLRKSNLATFRGNNKSIKVYFISHSNFFKYAGTIKPYSEGLQFISADLLDIRLLEWKWKRLMKAKSVGINSFIYIRSI